MEELKTVTQRDKWEWEMEQRKAEAEQIQKEFEQNPDVNPFETEVTK